MAWHWALLVMLLITWIPGLPYVRVIVFDAQDITRSMLNSSGPTDAIWRWRSWSTLVQVMAWCLTAPSHYLNQHWLISKILWHSSGDIIIRFENYIYKIALRSAWAKELMVVLCFVLLRFDITQFTNILMIWFTGIWGIIWVRRLQGKSIKGCDYMMTSSKGNIFRVTGPLCGEFTGHRWIPLPKPSDAKLWCFLWSASE